MLLVPVGAGLPLGGDDFVVKSLGNDVGDPVAEKVRMFSRCLWIGPPTLHLRRPLLSAHGRAIQ